MQFFRPNVKDKLISFAKIFTIIFFFLTFWRHCHKSAQIYRLKFADLAAKCLCLCIQFAGLQQRKGLQRHADVQVVVVRRNGDDPCLGGEFAEELAPVQGEGFQQQVQAGTVISLSGGLTIQILENGNIHFGTESGNYYVVDKDCKLVAKKDLTTLMNEDERYKADMTFEAAKVYSSVVIGDDGKVFVQFTNNDANKKREFGAIVCLEVGGCTGVGNTPWPMFGQNRRHTNCEK